DLELTGRLLLRLARHAHANRRFDFLETICDSIAVLLPGTSFAQAAHYHKAHCLRIKGRPAEAQILLAEAVEQAPAEFKGRALLTLAGTCYDTGEIRELAAFSTEALQASRGLDLLSETQAMRNLAIASAIGENHQAALATLEHLLPAMRALGIFYPVDLLSHLNSLAIELGEVGKVDEANRVIDYVLSTPFAKNQPEWHDTKLELATKPRLVFPPFTMALGASSEPEQQSTPKRLAESATESGAATDGRSDRAQSAERVQRAAQQFRSNETRQLPLPVPMARVSSTAACAPWAGRAFQNIDLSGYAIAPPARAPPTRTGF
ncbi:MAG: hypothetical protein ACREAC_00350, partial [Blastocatellia bacterium]